MSVGIKKSLYAWMISKRYKLHLAKTTIIEGKCEFSKGGQIYIGENTKISRWSCFKEYGGYIKIGDNCTVNSFCHLSGNGGIEIGDNVRIATQCVLISANHIFSNPNIPIRLQGEEREKIIVEDDVWLGAGVKVLKGVKIGVGSVIGAGAVVTKDVPPYSIAVGVPCKVIGSRKM